MEKKLNNLICVRYKSYITQREAILPIFYLIDHISGYTCIPRYQSIQINDTVMEHEIETDAPENVINNLISVFDDPQVKSNYPYIVKLYFKKIEEAQA